jgi:hypothetical protein
VARNVVLALFGQVKKKYFLKMAAEINPLLNLWPVSGREEPYDGRLSRTVL